MLAITLMSLLMSGVTDESAFSETRQDGTGLAAYVHPVAPLIAANNDEIPYFFAVTLEKEILKAKSLVLQLQYGTRDRGTEYPSYMGTDPDYVRHRSWAIRASMRSYFNDLQHEGWYVAGSAELAHVNSVTDKSSRLATSLSSLGYFGFRGKWARFTAYADVGAGIVILNSYRKSNGSNESSYDVGGNIGVGVPF